MTFRTLLEHLNSLAELKPEALDQEISFFVDEENDHFDITNLMLHKAAITKSDNGKSRLYLQFKREKHKENDNT